MIAFLTHATAFATGWFLMWLFMRRCVHRLLASITVWRHRAESWQRQYLDLHRRWDQPCQTRRPTA